jgi:hypothetical protein
VWCGVDAGVVWMLVWCGCWCLVEPYLDADLVQLLNNGLEVVQGADAPVPTQDDFRAQVVSAYGPPSH